ncbi:MAG: hypothetical protein ACR2K3_09025 [Nocardioides sp.]
MTLRLLARSAVGLALAGLLVASSAQAGTSAAHTPAPARHASGQPNAEWLMMGLACGAHNS